MHIYKWVEINVGKHLVQGRNVGANTRTQNIS